MVAKVSTLSAAWKASSGYLARGSLTSTANSASEGAFGFHIIAPPLVYAAQAVPCFESSTKFNGYQKSCRYRCCYSY